MARRTVLRVHPHLGLDSSLRFACAATVRIARDREMIAACLHRSIELFARRQPRQSPFAGIIVGLREAVGLDSHVCQECVTLRKSHGVEKPRDQALDDHEAFARGESEAALRPWSHERRATKLATHCEAREEHVEVQHAAPRAEGIQHARCADRRNAQRAPCCPRCSCR